MSLPIAFAIYEPSTGRFLPQATRHRHRALHWLDLSATEPPRLYSRPGDARRYCREYQRLHVQRHSQPGSLCANCPELEVVQVSIRIRYDAQSLEEDVHEGPDYQPRKKASV